MPGVLLFCATEEAKSFAPEVLSNREDVLFYIAESRGEPTPNRKFKEKLEDGETFETDFIGVSMEDCGSWALKQQDINSSIEKDVIAIIDNQSIKDQTIIMALYTRQGIQNFLRQDQEINTWYGFRVPLSKSRDIITLIPIYGNPWELYGVYFWRKEELTDEHGIFDIDKAVDLELEGEGRVFVEMKDDKIHTSTAASQNYIA